jgi:hypothetical protein
MAFDDAIKVVEDRTKRTILRHLKGSSLFSKEELAEFYGMLSLTLIECVVFEKDSLTRARRGVSRLWWRYRRAEHHQPYTICRVLQPKLPLLAR